jgi:hypothetical protein
MRKIKTQEEAEASRKRNGKILAFVIHLFDYIN